MFFLSLPFLNISSYSLSLTNLFSSNTPSGILKGLKIINNYLPKLGTVLLCSTVLFFDLGFVTNIPHFFVSVWFEYFNFLNSHWIQKGRNSFPPEPNGAWSIDCKHFTESSSVSEWHFWAALFYSAHWHFSNSHSTQIINYHPAFDLTWNKHAFDNLFVHIDWSMDARLDVFKVDKFGVKNQNGSEIEVSTNWVKEARFLFLIKNY